MGGGKTQTSTSSTTIPQQVLDRYNSVNANAQTVAQTPFKQYSSDPSSFVAQLSNTQNSGIANTNQYANAAQPYYGAATGATVAGMQAANPDELNTQQYMSPWLNSVVGSTAAQMQNQNQQQQSALQGNAIQAGAFGGDRSGIAQGNLANQQSLANNQVLSGLLNQGYMQAQGVGQQQQGVNLGAQQANLAREMAGGQQLAGLGAGAQAAGLQGAQAQLQAGQQQQQTQQAGLSALYNQFLQQQSYPFQTAQFLANIAEGTGALSGSTTSTTSPAPFFSDKRLKENVQTIGKTFDGQKIVKFQYKGSPHTQIGLIAQDVETKHPHAVGLSSGFKTVDYDAATEKSAKRGHFYSGGLVNDSMGGSVNAMNGGERFDDGGTPSSIDTTGMSPYSGVPPRFQVSPMIFRHLPPNYPVIPQNNTGLTQIKQLMDMAPDAQKTFQMGQTAYDGASSFFGNRRNSGGRTTSDRTGRDNGGGLPYENDNSNDPNYPDNRKLNNLNIPNQQNTLGLKTSQNQAGLNPQVNQFKNAADTVKNIYGLGQSASTIANLVAPAAITSGGGAATGALGGLGSILSLIPFFATGGAAKPRHFDDGGNTGNEGGGNGTSGDTGGGATNTGGNETMGNQEGGGNYGESVGSHYQDPNGANFNGMSPSPTDYGSPSGISATAYDNAPSDVPTPPMRHSGLGYNSNLDSGGDTAYTNSGPNLSPVSNSPYSGLGSDANNYGDTSYTNAGPSDGLNPYGDLSSSQFNNNSTYGDLSSNQFSGNGDVSPTAFANGNYGPVNSPNSYGDLSSDQFLSPADVPVPPGRPVGLGAPLANSSDSNNLNPDVGLTDPTARDIAIRTILAEGGTTDPSQMAAIGSVMINRYNNGYGGNDYNNIGEVATQPKQFSAWNSNNVGTSNDPNNFNQNGDAYKAAAATYDGLVNGTISDPTNGAMMYANPALANAAWVRKMQNSGNYVTLGSKGHQQIYGNLARGGLIPHKSGGGPLGDIPANSRVYIPPEARAKQQQQQQQQPTNFDTYKNPIWMDDLYAKGGLIPRKGYDTGGNIQSDDPSADNYVPNPSDMAIYTANSAEDNGINPRIANNVWNIESKFKGNSIGDNGTSYGVTQLHKGGLNPDFPNSGLGDEFQQQTGLDPSNPRNWQQEIDWTNKQIPKTGWSPWENTQKKLGLGNWSGINGNPADMPSQNAVNAGPTDMPTDSGNPVGNAYNSAKGWLSDTGNRNLALSVLSGIGKMASSNSRYLGAAALQGIGGGADTYQNLLKQTADIAKTQAETGYTGAQTQRTQADIANMSLANRAGIKTTLVYDPASGQYKTVLLNDPRNGIIPVTPPATTAPISGVAPVPQPGQAATPMPGQQSANPEGAYQTDKNGQPVPPTAAQKAAFNTSHGENTTPSNTAVNASNSGAAPQPGEAFTPTPQEAADLHNTANNWWTYGHETKEPDFYTDQAVAANGAQKQKQILVPLAKALSDLPRTNNAQVSGPIQEVYKPIAAYMNNLANIAGVPNLIQDPNILANQEVVHKLTNQLQASATTVSGQRAYEAFKSMAEGIPGIINSPQAQAKMIPQIMTNAQRDIDANEYLSKARVVAQGNNPLLSDTASQTSRLALQNFNNTYGNDYYESERNSIERMFNDTDRKTGKSIMSIMANGQPLSPAQTAQIKKVYGPNILRYFGRQ